MNRLIAFLIICTINAQYVKSADPIKLPALPSISVTPFTGKAVKLGTPIKLYDNEFELLQLDNYVGKLTWYVMSPDGTAPPLNWFQTTSKTTIIGKRAGQTEPAKYETSEAPAVAVFPKATGRAVVSAWGIGTDGAPKLLASLIVDAQVSPRPDPKPPGPDPKPDDGTSPFVEAGFRCLIVFESKDESTMPRGQLQIIYSKAIRDYLDSKCVLGPDNKQHEYRIYDQNVDVSGESKVWQNIMARKRTSVPWIAIGDGKTGYEGPLPKDIDETLTLLKKYGGN